jgi:hypothetical protein
MLTALDVDVDPFLLHPQTSSSLFLPTGRQSSLMKNDKLFTMGTSFDERSDEEEEEAAIELNVPVRRNNNSTSKNLTVENIPLVSK